MDTDDLDPRPRMAVPRPLDAMSVEELEAHIRALEGEIARARKEVAARLARRSAADAFFRT
jgi:uncharacterized small protein (DUF1192 family)